MAIFSAVMLLLWVSYATDAGADGDYPYAGVDFTSASTNDPPGTLDPGYAKDVASCRASIMYDDKVNVLVENGYPSYTCTFTVTVNNTGVLPLQLQPLVINAPWVLTVTPLQDDTGLILLPGARDAESFSVHVEQPAAQGATYAFTIQKTFRLHATGTIGFWKNWNSHKTFPKAAIETWLQQINTASQWFGPTTTSGMVSLINAGTGGSATPKSRFLAQCLATRLNERSGIMDGPDLHNVSAADPGNYLGLATPSAATLNQIIAAIEAKYGTSPSNAQFTVMKSVCDGINNLQL